MTPLPPPGDEPTRLELVREFVAGFVWFLIWAGVGIGAVAVVVEVIR